MADELADKFTGSVLICGSAPCLLREIDKALNALPEAHVIALNDAAGVIWADMLCSLHHEFLARFRARSQNPNVITVSGALQQAGSDVDYWFTDCNSGGTSAGSAIKIARKMGFGEIILCGCPMDGGEGYFDQPYKKPVPLVEPVRFGHAAKDSRMVVQHQQHLQREAEDNDYSMVRSLSGFTARLFGTPEFMRA